MEKTSNAYLNKRKILQSDGRMPWVIQRYGCNFRSLLGICESYCRKLLTPEQILRVYIEAIHKRFNKTQGMLKDCTVQVPQIILTLGFEELLRPDLIAYDIGSDGIEGKSFWPWVQDKTISATILKHKTVNGNEHFQEGDADGELVFDPDPTVELDYPLAVIYYQIKNKT